MDIQKIKDITEEMASIKIDRAIIEPTNTPDEFIIRGADKNTTLAVFSKTNHPSLTPGKLGIHDVQMLLGRLNLLDLTKTKAEVVDGRSYIKSVILKQGRSKVSYTFCDPNQIRDVPLALSTPEIVSEITFTKESFEYFTKAITAMRPAYVNMTSKKDEVFLNLHDGVSDTFEMMVGSNLSNTVWSHSWATQSMVTALKQQTHKSLTESAVLLVGKTGLIYTVVGELDVVLLPQMVE